MSDVEAKTTSDASMADAKTTSDASMAEAEAKSHTTDASMAEAKSAASDASMPKSGSGVSVVPEAATPAASPMATPTASPTATPASRSTSTTADRPAATVANTLTHEHYVHLTLVVTSVVDVFKEVHTISDDVEVDLEKVTSTFETVFLQMMKEEGLGSSRSLVQYSVGSNSTPGSSVGGPTPVKMEE